MMQMSGRNTVCCVALFLVLTPVSATKKLHSISDLKKINIGQSVPKHSLVLLYWFASSVEMDTNNNIWMSFNPNNGDYGSHHYGNYEGLLDQLPHRQRYYTVGNVYQDSSVQLPSYFVNYETEDRSRNIARIIIRVRGLNMGGRRAQRIDRVYITQHYETSEYDGTEYDAQHTYEISTNLLREIRAFSVGDNQQSLRNLRHQYAGNIDNFRLNDIRNTWHNLAGLGLLLFIVMQEKYSSFQYRAQSAQRNNTPSQPLHNLPENKQNPRNNNNFDIILIVLVFICILFYIFNIRR